MWGHRETERIDGGCAREREKKSENKWMIDWIILFIMYVPTTVRYHNHSYFQFLTANKH